MSDKVRCRKWKDCENKRKCRHWKAHEPLAGNGGVLCSNLPKIAFHPKTGEPFMPMCMEWPPTKLVAADPGHRRRKRVVEDSAE